jgi:hypothetical protein
VGYAIQPVETEQEKQLYFKLLAEADSAGGSSSSGSSTFGCAPSRGINWGDVADAFNTAVRTAWDAGHSRDSLRMKNVAVLVKYYNSFSKEHRVAAARVYAQQRSDAAAAATAAGGTPGATAVSAHEAVATTAQGAAGVAASSGQQQMGASNGLGWQQQQQGGASRRGQQLHTGTRSRQQQQQRQQHRQQQAGVSASQQPNWLAAAGAQVPPKPKAKGKGLGGKGVTKVCVPCSLAADESLRTADDARDRCSVVSGRAHTCPYCKCTDCKKVWDRKKGSAVVNRDQLAGTLRDNLPMGHAK